MDSMSELKRCSARLQMLLKGESISCKLDNSHMHNWEYIFICFNLCLPRLKDISCFTKFIVEKIMNCCPWLFHRCLQIHGGYSAKYKACSVKTPYNKHHKRGKCHKDRHFSHKTLKTVVLLLMLDNPHSTTN